ncbi:unnamed protein product [Blepharisma stoltei]|uniref:Uncharacterized protein n=1 Tax=Blepharisma stoltei TaxID=1481888 RepID=A0AAU9IHI4_9CILI|nr:unnamed protein product [Blepharisma stoltei]
MEICVWRILLLIRYREFYFKICWYLILNFLLAFMSIKEIDFEKYLLKFQSKSQLMQIWLMIFKSEFKENN